MADQLDWSNFEGPKRNVDWKPDDQDLIYTALNYRDDEYGDADDDVGQQIAERLLSAWNRAAVSELLTFDISARLLKDLDAARSVLRKIEHWAQQKCPCHNEQPNPCPLCGASVENLEACKAVESIFPRDLLVEVRSITARA
jgi:hypothetical protein